MNNLLPHHDVYCRIGRSKIHGVGVIAILDLAKGIDPFKHAADDYHKIKKTALIGLRPAISSLYEDFCAVEGEYLWAPKHFNRINISWFLNHSRKPNVAPTDKTGSFFVTLRKIKAGEELLSDYNTYCEKGHGHD